MIDTYHYCEVTEPYQYRLKQPPRELAEKIDSRSMNIVSDATYTSAIVTEWISLALDEALNVLKHYCDLHLITCTHTKSIVSTIQRSLTISGLALTSRYIYSSVRNAANYLTEIEQENRQAIGLVHRNLNFWLDDERAKNYDTTPFSRKGAILHESEKVHIFSHMFLMPLQANYFLDPIINNSLNSQTINQSEV